MRPLTKAIFEREGKDSVGSQGTLEQVWHAYENADDLLDYIVECKSLKYVQQWGLEQAYFCLAAGLEDRMVEKIPHKAMQILSLSILKKLLERGLNSIIEAVSIYQNSPEIFKTKYASSKAAFFKDLFFDHRTPVYSFPPLKTGENPALTRDEKLSGLCAKLYQNANLQEHSAAWLFFSNGGDNVMQEAILISDIIENVRKNRLGDKGHTFSIIPMRLHRSK